MNLSSYLKKSLQVMLGVGLGQAISIIFLPLITRLYSPQNFTEYSNFLYFSSLFSTILIFRFDNILVPVRFEPKRKFLFGYFIGVYAVASCLIFLVWITCRAVQSENSIYLERVNIFMLFLLGASTTALFQFVVGGFIARAAYGSINKLRIGQALGLSGGQVIFGLNTFLQKTGLMFGEIASRFLAVIYYAPNLKFRPFILVHKFKVFKRAAKPFIRQGFFSTLSTLLSTASLLSPIFFTKFSLDGAHAAGYFILAYKIVSVPVSLISRSMAQVFLGEGKFFGEKEVAAAIKKGTFVNTLLAVIISSCILVFSFYSNLLFGEAWVEASSYIRGLIPLVVGQIILLPLVQLFTIKNKNGQLLIWEFSRFFLVHLIVGVVIYYGASGIQIVEIYSVAMFFSYFILFAAIFKKWA